MSKFNASYRGIGEMLCMPEIQAEMLIRAHLVADAAEAAAPVDETGPHPGRYKGAFEVSSGIRGGSRSTGRHRRAYGRVTNTAPEALYVEYGNVNTPRHATLRRALLEAGG